VGARRPSVRPDPPPLDVDGFWALVEQTSGDPIEIATLVDELADEDVTNFLKILYAQRSRLLGAGLDDACVRLIGLGREAFDAALASPKVIPALADHLPAGEDHLIARVRDIWTDRHDGKPAPRTA
jgi:hypothetical protein